MLHLQRKRFHAPNLHLTKEQTESYALAEIESLMQKLGRSLRDIDGMSQPDTSLTQDLANRLLNEELDYDRAALKILHEKSLNALNYFQKSAYDAILHSVEHDEGKLFFVSGHGGTGKTFLWDTIASKLRSESLIVLPVATSGLASLLLPNGRTAHSRFRIPLDITAESTCEIKHGTQLAKLLQKTSLIIWDEAPMTHKYCFEALDKTLRDLLSTRYADSRTKPFGGLTIVCGGDFRQILPVIPQGERADIIDASLNSSYLWPHFKIFELKQNMRLHRVGVDEIQAEKITSFDRWLLQIGDGSLYDNPAQEMIKIPPELCRPTSKNSMEAIVAEVYPSLLENYKDPAYLKERAILTPKNETVYELNDFLMNMIPGEGRTYLSSDSVCKASIKADDDLLYPTEFLNSLRFSGVPNHDIRLQEGTPVMLLRNLNQSGGLCNGTRLIVTRLGKWSIRADIISGTKIGQNVTIPRIIMSPKESKWPFKLNRRQLPVAPCFAMTINKSQGQSLKRVGLYLPGQVFTHGQVYVALSRVTAIEGLVIVNSDNEVKDHSLIKNIVYKEGVRPIAMLCGHAAPIVDLDICFPATVPGEEKIGELSNVALNSSLVVAFFVTFSLEEKCQVCREYSNQLTDTYAKGVSNLNNSQVEAVLNALCKVKCDHMPSVELIWGPQEQAKQKMISFIGESTCQDMVTLTNSLNSLEKLLFHDNMVSDLLERVFLDQELVKYSPKSCVDMSLLRCLRTNALSVGRSLCRSLLGNIVSLS
ncbi:uncharacterized protein LOC141715157 [Apium graveolens]|uniref:uncharacterized protein LOC141715157 n=1 Tax=Apium graveolens TaxID=4045 RepID=UPI003D7A92F4